MAIIFALNLMNIFSRESNNKKNETINKATEWKKKDKNQKNCVHNLRSL